MQLILFKTYCMLPFLQQSSTCMKLYIQGMVEKISKLMLYLPREKWTKNEMLTFFKIVPLAFQNTYSIKFFIGQSPYEITYLI